MWGRLEELSAGDAPLREPCLEDCLLCSWRALLADTCPHPCLGPSPPLTGLPGPQQVWSRVQTQLTATPIIGLVAAGPDLPEGQL